MSLKKALLVAVVSLFIVFTIMVVYILIKVDLTVSKNSDEIVNDSKVYIEFSEIAGLYNHSVTININSFGDVGNIFYTTDYTRPSANDNLYTGESFTFDIIPNEERVYTIRAIGIKEDGTYTTNEIVSTYILNENIDTRYTTAVLSLVTEKSNLFDRKTGIFSNSNLYKAGMEYERDIHLEYFESDGKLVISQHGGIRLFGGYSRAHPQKSIRLYARKIYDDTGVFYFNPLTNQRGRYTGKLIFEYQKLLFRNSGNDWCVTQFRDALIQRMAERTNVDYQDYKPMVVYLNGEYYGILNFREDTGTKYFENHYGIPEEGVTVISSHLQDGNIPRDKTQYVLDSGASSELAKWKKDLEFAFTADMKNSDNYEEVCKRIDVENFAQYMLLQIYIANTDWPQNNIRLWRFNTLYDNRLNVKNDSHGFDGRWRFVLKDTDFGLDMYDGNQVKHNTLAHAMGSGDVFGLGKVLSNLLKNDKFKELFIITMCDLLNYATDPDYLIQIISEMQIGISGEIPYQMKRWRGSSNSSVLRNWDVQVEKMRKFVYNRPENLYNIFKKTFKLSDEVTLTVTGSEHGTVYINSIPIRGNEVKSFKYFTDMGINIKFEADYGYIFLQHNMNDAIEFNNSEIILHGEAYLEPVFIEDKNYRKTIVINEYMASSTKDHGYDWVEIYNNSDRTINLKDYFLTDNINNIDKWQFPGYAIKSGQYLVVKLTSEDRFSGLDDIHTNFCISEDETLSLIFRDGSIIDSVKIQKSETDPSGNVLTMGRYPNHTGAFVQLNSKSPGLDNIFIEYSKKPHPSLNNRVLINGELKDTSYYAYIQDDIPYISIDGEVYSASDYAMQKKLKFIYVYSLNSIVFTK